ncbi:MAG: vWA domain-containing protein, partial [Planctomycetota bacterium]
ELLVAAHAREEGRLRDDAADALRAVTGQKTDDWPGWWSSLAADWSPPKPPPAKGEVDLSLAPGVFSDGKVTCFNITTSSRALVYCVEAARPEPWESLRDELIRSIETLPDGAKFGIVVYGAEAKPWRKRLANSDPGTRANAIAFLNKHKPGGGADLLAGVTAALKLAGGSRSTPPAADTIFLATFYGQATGLYEEARQAALEVLPQNELKGVRIHAWGKSEGGDSFYLQMICRAFEGTHRPLGR